MISTARQAEQVDDARHSIKPASVPALHNLSTNQTITTPQMTATA
jgi:hypothetical protein